MVHKKFIGQILEIIKPDDNIIGLTVGGSWIQKEIDDFSDLDLVLVTRDKITDTAGRMMGYASKFGQLLAAFTGEHVGEPRLLICLYDNPLLHVDIKFLAPEEFYPRVETPEILYDREGILANIFSNTTAVYPAPDQQWIEDRFWVWVHYAATKIGRGELFEALDMLSFLRSRVTGPLLQVKHDLRGNGVRKMEMKLPSAALESLALTVAGYDSNEIVRALEATIVLYRRLRETIFASNVRLKAIAEERAVAYFREIATRVASSTGVI